MDSSTCWKGGAMQSVQELSTSPGDLALEMVREWTLSLTDVERRLMPHFARREARRHVGAYLRGLLSATSSITGTAASPHVLVRPVRAAVIRFLPEQVFVSQRRVKNPVDARALASNL